MSDFCIKTEFTLKVLQKWKLFVSNFNALESEKILKNTKHKKSRTCLINYNKGYIKNTFKTHIKIEENCLIKFASLLNRTKYRLQSRRICLIYSYFYTKI